MSTADVLTRDTKRDTHSEWNIVPSAAQPNSFDLKTKTGHTLCILTFPKAYDKPLLNLIASAPELQDIAEMYRDSMIGNKAEKTMVFAIVTKVLQRVQ